MKDNRITSITISGSTEGVSITSADGTPIEVKQATAAQIAEDEARPHSALWKMLNGIQVAAQCEVNDRELRRGFETRLN